MDAFQLSYYSEYHLTDRKKSILARHGNQFLNARVMVRDAETLSLGELDAQILHVRLGGVALLSVSKPQWYFWEPAVF